MALKRRFLLLLILLGAGLNCAAAATPTCVRSALLLVCEDGMGGTYSVLSQGADTVTRCLPGPQRRTWTQTNSRYGQLTLFSGVASDGEVWLGRIQTLGWTTLSRFSSSRSGSQTLRCNRLTGCSAVQPKALFLMLAR